MKVLGYIAASLAILICGSLYGAGVWLPIFYQPAQRAVEPYVCPEGWHLVTETYSCQGDAFSECSDVTCVSPDGSSRAGAGRLHIFWGVTLVGMLLFIGVMTGLIVLMSIRKTHKK